MVEHELAQDKDDSPLLWPCSDCKDIRKIPSWAVDKRLEVVHFVHKEEDRVEVGREHLEDQEEKQAWVQGHLVERIEGKGFEELTVRLGVSIAAFVGPLIAAFVVVVVVVVVPLQLLLLPSCVILQALHIRHQEHEHIHSCYVSFFRKISNIEIPRGSIRF